MKSAKDNYTSPNMAPAAIQKRLAEFEKFINDPKNAEHVKKVIAQINKEAGVKPVTLPTLRVEPTAETVSLFSSPIVFRVSFENKTERVMRMRLAPSWAR